MTFSCVTFFENKVAVLQHCCFALSVDKFHWTISLKEFILVKLQASSCNCTQFHWTISLKEFILVKLQAWSCNCTPTKILCVISQGCFTVGAEHLFRRTPEDGYFRLLIGNSVFASWWTASRFLRKTMNLYWSIRFLKTSLPFIEMFIEIALL